MGLLDDMRKNWFKNHAVEHDSFDMMEYSKIHEKSSNVRKTEKEGRDRFAGFPELMQDAFFSLYKMYPELVDEEKVASAFQFNREQIAKFMETSDYKEMRLISSMNEFNSAIGALSFAGDLIKEIARNKELSDVLTHTNQAIEAQRDANALGQEVERLENTLETARSGGKSGQIKKLEQQLQNAQANQQAAEAIAEDHAAMAQDVARSHQSALRQAVRRAADATSTEVNETSNALEAWGMGGEGFQKLPIEKKFQLAELIRKNKKFTQMADLVGRFRHLAKAKQKAKLKKQQPEIYSVATGRDIQRILPSELVLAGSEGTKPLFYKKFMGQSFLQYSLKSRDKAGRGPIVVLLDSSGSTAGRVEEYEKAIAMGLLEIAHKHRRAFAVVFFSDRSDPQTGNPLPLKVIEFGTKEIDPLQIIEMAAYFENGGTNFETPLQEGAEILKRSDYANGDLVMLTDGQCRLGSAFLDAFLQLKKAKGFKVYSIVISLGGRHTLDSVRPFSDYTALVRGLNDATAEDLFAAV